MKITHICLIGPFTDGWNYQENLLTKYHKNMGYEVSVITSKFTYDNNGKIIVDERGQYFNEYGIKIIRLDTKFNSNYKNRFKKFRGFYTTLCAEKPDIIFVHGCQFRDIKYVAKYAKWHPNVKIYVDNHADYSNSATNWVSKNILHKIIWKKYAKLIEPYTIKFYGVTPARVNFLKDLYNLPEEKIDLLPMGADDEKVYLARNDISKRKIRDKHGISRDDFLIVTGGKIDIHKRQTLLLMEAVKRFNNKVKLIVFGSIDDSLKEKVNELVDNEIIQYIGWLSLMKYITTSLLQTSWFFQEDILYSGK